MKDTIILGSISGIIANLLKTIIAWVFNILGLTKFTFIHINAGYFVDERFVKTPIGLATGVIGDFTMAAFLGVLIVLTLKLTGTDYAIIKGAGFGSVSYIFLFGIGMALDVTRVSIMTPLPNLILFFPQIVFGALTSWIAVKYGQIKLQTKQEPRRFRFTPSPTLKRETSESERELKKPTKIKKVKH